jgi:hypothetical protein
MAGDFPQRYFEQFFSWRDLVPGRRAGWMRERNQIENMSSPVDAKFAPDHFFQLPAMDKLRDGQTADRNYETRI